LNGNVLESSSADSYKEQIAMDLYTPVVESRRLHPNFVAISRDSEASKRKVIAEWAAGFVDRDGKFVREFQTTFNSSFWGLYLFACIKELGLTVDFSYASPGHHAAHQT
jgi:hypothetical protein